jgi:fructose-bisphosphate aldolase class I
VLPHVSLGPCVQCVQVVLLANGDQNIMLKLSIPSRADLYKELVDHPRDIPVIAPSGGYLREEANRLPAQSTGVIASFSRNLAEGLTAQQSDAEFNTDLNSTIQCIYYASID